MLLPVAGLVFFAKSEIIVSPLADAVRLVDDQGDYILLKPSRAQQPTNATQNLLIPSLCKIRIGESCLLVDDDRSRPNTYPEQLASVLTR